MKKQRITCKTSELRQQRIFYAASPFAYFIPCSRFLHFLQQHLHPPLLLLQPYKDTFIKTTTTKKSPSWDVCLLTGGHLLSMPIPGCSIVLDTNLLPSQHCFFLPVPPNLTISLQDLHFPQSGCWHTSHTPHRFLRGALVSFPSIWFSKKMSNMCRTRGVVVAWDKSDFKFTSGQQTKLIHVITNAWMIKVFNRVTGLIIPIHLWWSNSLLFLVQSDFDSPCSTPGWNWKIKQLRNTLLKGYLGEK